MDPNPSKVLQLTNGCFGGTRTGRCPQNKQETGPQSSPLLGTGDRAKLTLPDCTLIILLTFGFYHTSFSPVHIKLIVFKSEESKAPYSWRKREELTHRTASNKVATLRFYNPPGGRGFIWQSFDWQVPHNALLSTLSIKEALKDFCKNSDIIRQPVYCNNVKFLCLWEWCTQILWTIGNIHCVLLL